MLLLPALVTQAGVLAPTTHVGEYIGAYGLGINLTAVLGPWIGTSLLEHREPHAVVLVSGRRRSPPPS